MGLEINISDVSLLFGAFVTLFVLVYGMKKALQMFER